MAVLPRAQASSTPLGAADFASIHAELDSCSGTPNALSALDRFLVRQNPWSKFDPEGLNETFGDNLVADYLAPDPKGSYHEAGRQAAIMFDPNADTLERVGGALGFLGNGIGCVVDCIPGVGNLKRGVVKKLGAEIVEHTGEKVIKEGAENIAKHALEGGAERLAKRTDDAVEGSAKKLTQETEATAKTLAQDSKQVTENTGRSGKQARLRELADDPNVSSVDRGWIKQEENSIARGQRDTIRNPPGKDLAHERGREAAKGYSYEHSNLQDRDLHRTQHKFDDFGRANKERPLKPDEK